MSEGLSDKNTDKEGPTWEGHGRVLYTDSSYEFSEFLLYFHSHLKLDGSAQWKLDSQKQFSIQLIKATVTWFFGSQFFSRAIFEESGGR